MIVCSHRNVAFTCRTIFRTVSRVSSVPGHDLTGRTNVPLYCRICQVKCWQMVLYPRKGVGFTGEHIESRAVHLFLTQG